MSNYSDEQNCTVFDEELRIDIGELCRACEVNREELRAWIEEGAIEVSAFRGEGEWFVGTTVSRVRQAWRLQNDLGLNPAGTALALELLDEIRKLRVQLRQLEHD